MLGTTKILNQTLFLYLCTQESVRGYNIFMIAKSLIARASTLWLYCSQGVWRDTRSLWRVKAVKTLNLSFRSFLNVDLQSASCAMTYRTLLAVVPALALLVAIGRGFGLQGEIRSQLFRIFPSQRHALDTALDFVDTYLNQTTEGLFVGVGIVVLLWTLISLLGSVEESFNRIWRLKAGRPFWRKITDYTAILLILPVLMICAGGMTLLVSTTISSLLPVDISQLSWLFDIGSILLTWLFFAGAYMLIPDTRVRFVNAFGAGIFAGSAFQILQWLFVTGQMYVARYNAIYGSFSFLPLLLVWLQLEWMVTLAGALLCYASQNISRFDFQQDINAISPGYMDRTAVVMMAVVARRFANGLTPMTAEQIGEMTSIPPMLAVRVARRLVDAGLMSLLESGGANMPHPMQPSSDVTELRVGQVLERLRKSGSSDFLPSFDSQYHDACLAIENLWQRALIEPDPRILDLDIPSADIHS